MQLIRNRNYYITTIDGKTFNVKISRFVKHTQTYHAINMNTMKSIQFKRSKVTESREKRNIHLNVKSNGEKTYLYIIKTSNDTYKFGSTTNIMQRQKQILTTSEMSVLVALREIPSQISQSRYKIEKNFQKHFGEFHCKNGGSEMFKMSEEEAKKAIKQLNSMRFK